MNIRGGGNNQKLKKMNGGTAWEKITRYILMEVIQRE
jgi:hypothetical protein